MANDATISNRPSGMFDRTCRKCRRRYGWAGTMKDCPPNCPKCGTPLSEKEKADLAKDEEMMNEFRQQLLKKQWGVKDDVNNNSDPPSNTDKPSLE